MIRRSALLLLAAAMPAATTGHAAEAADPFLTASVVSDEELDAQRGGFRWQGVDIQLGAEIRSYLDGQLVMQTNINLTADRMETTRFVSGALTKADAAALQAGLLGEGAIRLNGGGEDAYLANDGRTAFIQRENGLQNIVLNTASNTAIRQDIDLRIDLGNFAPLQAQFGAQRMSEAIGSMIASAGIR